MSGRRNGHLVVLTMLPPFERPSPLATPRSPTPAVIESTSPSARVGAARTDSLIGPWCERKFVRAAWTLNPTLGNTFFRIVPQFGSFVGDDQVREVARVVRLPEEVPRLSCRGDVARES